MTPASPPTLARYRAEYAAQRAAEGRAYDVAALMQLPYLERGRAGDELVRQWTVRARTFDAFVALVLAPAIRRRTRPLRLLDLGAGNGWLCWRASRLGCTAVAVDIRDDDVDGLGAARPYLERVATPFSRVVASFEALPLASTGFDIVAFNASLHYALDLSSALGEARRVVRDGGHIVVLDSPFYRREAAGAAMVVEKRRRAPAQFGARAAALMAMPFAEYLTRERLATASAELGLVWRRHRVRYPLWYEARPLVAWLRRHRTPSRFDLWECTAG